jgi:allantoinase
MPAERKRGMDHSLYAYSAIPQRAKLAWPGGSRVAFWICVHLEYWELDPPRGARHPPGIEGTWQIYAPDYRTYSYREYGNRIGIFRVLDALDQFGFRGTAAVNAEVCRRYPHLVEECLSRNWEIAAGGTYATRMITADMTEEEEIAHIAESREAVTARTGKMPAGWIGQDFNESARTPQLVADQGFKYIADWPNDDQPYWMKTNRPLVSLSPQTEWDDVTLLWMRQITTERYADVVLEAMRTLLSEGGRVFVLNVHPWLFGQPHRIKYLRRILGEIAGYQDVWRATAAEIADCFATQRNPTEE